MSTSSSCTDPGYITKLSLDGTAYHVFAYIEEADGSKRFLPATTDSNSQSLEKIRNLVTGLLQAHDARRTALSEAKYNYALATLDSRGLIKPDHSIVSHDFLIQPVENNLADQMARALSLQGHPMEVSAVKAQDVWTSLEGLIRDGIRTAAASSPATPAPANGANAVALPPKNPGNSATTPTSIPAIPPATSPAATTPAAIRAAPANAAPTPPTATTPLVSTPPADQAIPAPKTNQTQQAPVTATRLNMRGVNIEQSNWYDQIPDRTKSRIITDILTSRCPVGGVYEKVWNLFKERVNNATGLYTTTLLIEEQNRLSILCRAHPSPIDPIRNEAEALINAYHQKIADAALQEKILALIAKEFECKEQLFQCIREQAIAEGVEIGDWDHKWAEFHYIENTYRFVQALIRWLDNN